jgi:hypothetical protein
MNESKLPVSVVISTYKTREVTLKALAALFATAPLPAQVILIDNCSNDGSVEVYKQAYPQVEYVVNEKDLGFAGSNNRAIRDFTTQPYIWLLNSDTETGQHSLEQLYQYMEVHPNVGAVGPQLIYPNGTLQSTGGYFPSPLNVFLYLFPISKFLPKSVKKKIKQIALFPQPIPEEGLELDYVTAAAVLLRKKALDEAGLLAEDFYMYFEETDLCLRLKKRGWKRTVISTEPVMHIYGGSFKTQFDKRRLKLTLQSLVLFIKKNYIGWRRYVMLFEIFLLGDFSLLVKRLKNFI